MVRDSSSGAQDAVEHPNDTPTEPLAPERSPRPTRESSEVDLRRSLEEGLGRQSTPASSQDDDASDALLPGTPDGLYRADTGDRPYLQSGAELAEVDKADDTADGLASSPAPERLSRASQSGFYILREAWTSSRQQMWTNCSRACRRVSMHQILSPRMEEEMQACLGDVANLNYCLVGMCNGSDVHVKRH